MSDGSITFHRDPDKVRKVEFFHQPPAANTCGLRSST
jgi:hypothetical protein